MSTSQTHKLTYLAPLRDFEFLLWEQFRMQDVDGLDRSSAMALLRQVADFAEGPMALSYREGDEQEAALDEAGTVRTPDCYPGLMTQYRDIWNAWQTSSGPGGQPVNELMQNLIVEMLVGSHPAFVTYVGFNGPAQNLLGAYGSEDLKANYGPSLASLDASACLCITERQAGSDLSLLETYAVRSADGQYRMHGHKWLISAGMHELTGNIFYFVLARTDPTLRGVLGLSCFLVPRRRLDEHGRPTIDNGIRCREVARKMGLRGCANTHLDFGADGKDTIAYLLGETPGRGLQQLMMMMMPARISTGIYALGLASCAEGVAGRYARERVQGKRFDQAMSAKADSLAIELHPDVERMRLDMLAVTSGCRAILARLALCQTQLRTLPADDRRCVVARELLELLLPIVKAYTSDQAWRVTETAIQTMGGVGYLRDYPVEQNARDCKILSIWEGTNHMQALFLIRDKLGLCLRNSRLATMAGEIRSLLQWLEERQGWSQEIVQIRAALSAVETAAAAIGAAVRGGNMNQIPAYACDFLNAVAEIAVAWHLLEGASLAQDRLDSASNDEDLAFYADKVKAARHFLRRRLPLACASLHALSGELHSPTPSRTRTAPAPDKTAQLLV